MVKNVLTLTRLSKFLLRHGLVFDEVNAAGQRKGNWTGAYWSWIRSISFGEKADNEVLAFYVDAVRQAEEDKRRLEKLVADEASKPRWNVSATVKSTISANAD